MQFTLYVPGTTWLHRLDPITKLFMTGGGVTLSFVLASERGAAGLFAALTIALTSGRVVRRAGPLLVGVALIAATFLIVQGLVHPDNAHIWLRVGPFSLYREGLAVGLRLALRLYNILSAFMLLVLTTHPSELTEALVRRGLPPRAGYVMMSVLQIIPTMVSATAAITDAQRSRGMETEGRLWTRLGAFVPLMGPLVTSSLIATEERALALEVRGFGGSARPNFLKDESIPRYAIHVRLVVAAAVAFGVVARWRWGL